MSLVVSDELLGTFVPVVVYWLYSGLYVLLGSVEKYRLHSRKDEEEKNLVSKRDVVKGVLFQQALQILVAIILFKVVSGEIGTSSPPPAEAKLSSLFKIPFQIAVAMFVMDTWQYALHRLVHTSQFLYRHLHSRHHRLIVPYAYGALYNHPVEGLLLDTVSGALSFLISGMSPRVSIFFFSFATMKTVDDHCGMRIPGHPLQVFFANNSAYHDVHHQLYGAKYNYSQPFFVWWDKILGTHMPYSLEEKPEGGFEVVPHRKID